MIGVLYLKINKMIVLVLLNMHNVKSIIQLFRHNIENEWWWLIGACVMQWFAQFIPQDALRTQQLNYKLNGLISDLCPLNLNLWTRINFESKLSVHWCLADFPVSPHETKSLSSYWKKVIIQQNVLYGRARTFPFPWILAVQVSLLYLLILFKQFTDIIIDYKVIALCIQ